VVLRLHPISLEGAMGTVGLNFGAATSGTGFNVSSTVAEIVSNLQNVETPWKTQLTSLQSQDTVISSLGTMFSNLSNDISSLTDFTGVMAQKEGSSSDTNVLTLTAADSTAVSGTHTVTVKNLATTSSGYLTQIANANDPLTGSITLQAGSGPQLTITLNSSDNTLAGLASTINASGVGINASVLTDASGSMLSLVSATSGAGGNIVINSGTNTLSAADSVAMSYNDAGTTGTAAPDSGTLTALASAGDTVTGSMVIQAGSGTKYTIVAGKVPNGGAATDTVYTGTAVNTLSNLESVINLNESTIGFAASLNTSAVGSNAANTILTLTSNTNSTAGKLTVSSSLNDITGTTPLVYANPVVGKDANLTVDGVSLTSASNTVANLIPGVTFQLLAPSATESDGSLEQVQVVIANDNSGVESAMTQLVSDYNSLISAVNAQEGLNSSGDAEPLFGSPTLSLLQQQLLGALNMDSPNGTLTSVSSNANATLSGSMTIQVGSGTAETIVVGAQPGSGAAASTVYTGSGVNTLAGLASAINKADLGVTANVVTSGGQSTLAFVSATTGSSGALTVTSSLNASTDTALAYTDGGSNGIVDIGTLAGVPSQSDALTGSITIQVGTGETQTIAVPPNSNTSPSNNLSGLAGAIKSANVGVNASVIQNNDGSYSLQLQSETLGTTGDMTVTSNILDATNQTTTALTYGASSDINNLTTLGISVNDDGSLTFDAASMDSVLDSDFSGVTGFFQNASSWGQSFSTMLTNAGSSSATGILALASTSNSNIESTLNADITKEQSLISAQQSSLTTELNSANQVIESIPGLLDQVNELYSAITGYNQQTNG
jgi:flagellar hook-associated protein 2